MNTQISRARRMEKTLIERFQPLDFSIADDSAKHAGHAGARAGGETHYSVRLVSAVFEGLSRVARQRLVYEALRGEFETGLHALALDLKAPCEVPR